MFSRETLWQISGGSSFWVTDRLVIVATLQTLLKTSSTSGTRFSDLLLPLVEDLEGSRMAARDSLKEVKQQKGFISAAKKSTGDALNNVPDLLERVTASSRRQSEFFTNSATTLYQMDRATEELRQVRETITTQGKELMNIAQLQASIMDHDENVALYKASKEDLKG